MTNEHESLIIELIIEKVSDIMKRYIGELCLMMVAIIWGSGFAATAITLESYTPFQSIAGRFLIGAILFILLFYKHLRAIPFTTIVKGIILGSILYVAFALQTTGLAYTTPSKNAFLTAVNVVAVPFICLILFKRRVHRLEIVGAVLTVIGIALLSINHLGKINIGDILSLLCALAFAFHIIYTGIFVKTEKAISLTIVQFITAAMIGLIVIGIRGEMTVTIDPYPFAALIYLGVFSTGVAFFLQTYAQQFVNETKSAILLSTEAVWGMVFSVLIINEIITQRMIVGALFIIIAILITELKGQIFFISKEKKT